MRTVGGQAPKGTSGNAVARNYLENGLQRGPEIEGLRIENPFL